MSVITQSRGIPAGPLTPRGLTRKAMVLPIRSTVRPSANQMPPSMVVSAAPSSVTATDRKSSPVSISRLPRCRVCPWP